MTTSTQPPYAPTISTTDDLAALWGTLMGEGRFASRTLWLAVLDESGRPSPVLVPIEGIPRVPTPSDVSAFSRALDGISDLGTVVMLISRPGSESIQEDDRSWSRALTPLAPEWPIHLATSGREGHGHIQAV
jgi:hypothetical protein